MHAVFKSNLKVKHLQCTFLYANWRPVACGTPFKGPVEMANIEQVNSSRVLPKPSSEIPGPRRLPWVGSTISMLLNKSKFSIQKYLQFQA